MTPGIEEGGRRQDVDENSVKTAKDMLRDIWRKLVESEERLAFFKKMVGHIGENQKLKVYFFIQSLFLMLYKKIILHF